MAELVAAAKREIRRIERHEGTWRAKLECGHYAEVSPGSVRAAELAPIDCALCAAGGGEPEVTAVSTPSTATSPPGPYAGDHFPADERERPKRHGDPARPGAGEPEEGRHRTTGGFADRFCTCPPEYDYWPTCPVHPATLVPQRRGRAETIDPPARGAASEHTHDGLRPIGLPPHDSRPDTYEHIAHVRGLLLGAATLLTRRAHRHDASKLAEPELAGFDEWTPRLAGAEYGSDAYRDALEQMRPFLAHHYEANDHHPEHFDDGIRGMSLLSLLEMLCDWIAAGRRPGGTGSILRSIEVNQERFGYSDELAEILRNTAAQIAVADYGQLG